MSAWVDVLAEYDALQKRLDDASAAQAASVCGKVVIYRYPFTDAIEAGYCKRFPGHYGRCNVAGEMIPVTV